MKNYLQVFLQSVTFFCNQATNQQIHAVYYNIRIVLRLILPFFLVTYHLQFYLTQQVTGGLVTYKTAPL